MEPVVLPGPATVTHENETGANSDSDSDSGSSSSDSDSDNGAIKQGMGEEGEENYGEAADAVPENLRPGGQEWSVIGELLVDPSSNRVNHTPRINWSGIHDYIQRTHLQYFFKCFPMRYMERILLHINNVMTNKRLGAQLSQEEFLNWIGLRLTMTLEHVKGDLSNLWDTEYDSDTVFKLPDTVKDLA